MKTRRRARLSSRLYVVGVVQLLLVAVAAVAIGFVVSKLQARGDARVAIARLQQVADEPQRLAAELESVRREESLLASVYDETGALVASNAKPPLHLPRWARHGFRVPRPALRGLPAPMGEPPHGDPPPHDFVRAPFDRPPPPPGHGPPRGPPPPPDALASFQVRGGEGTIVTRFAPAKPGLVPPLLTLVFGLGVFAAGAWLTARWIARPLQRLSHTARAFGEGDLGARARLERTDELGEVGFAFDEMAGRIQGLLAAEKELLANVAHELRTPLARIRVALEIAAEGDAEAAHASLGEIAVDLAELETIVDDILTAARLEAAEGGARRADFPLHLEDVAPESVAERAAERLRERHPARALDVTLGSDLGLIEADPVLLRRVLDNLLENAHKYSPDPTTRVALSVSADGGAVTFEVRDQGVGIPQEDLPRVFTAFFRGDRSRSRGTGGVGLGLTLAKRIVEAHGGTMAVESAARQGTTVRVQVPRANAAWRRAPENSTGSD